MAIQNHVITIIIRCMSHNNNNNILLLLLDDCHDRHFQLFVYELISKNCFIVKVRMGTPLSFIKILE